MNETDIGFEECSVLYCPEMRHSMSEAELIEEGWRKIGIERWVCPLHARDTLNVTVVGGMGKLGSVMAEHIRHYYPVRIADKHGEATRAATADADIVIIIVDTGSLPDGAYDISNVCAACEEVDVSRWKLVMICSTVNPGDTEGAVRWALERDGKRAHWDFGLVYVPELVRQGCVREDYARPTQVIAGVQTQIEESAVAEFCARAQDIEPTFMSIESAEIAKLAVNTFLTAKMAKANEVAWLCQYTPGADAKDVLEVVGADPRIADAYIRPGPPPGGRCFPRDDAALAAAWHKSGLGPAMCEGVPLFRRRQIVEMATLAGTGGKVGIAGLSFKSGVADATESPGMELSDLLHAETYDPKLPSTCGSLEELVDKCDSIVLAMPFEGDSALLDMDLLGKTIWDWWGTFGDVFLRFGKGQETC